MAAAWSSAGLVAVAVLVVGIAMPASAAHAQPPAPAPASYGETLHPVTSPWPTAVSLITTSSSSELHQFVGF